MGRDFRAWHSLSVGYIPKESTGLFLMNFLHNFFPQLYYNESQALGCGILHVGGAIPCIAQCGCPINNYLRPAIKQNVTFNDAK